MPYVSKEIREILRPKSGIIPGTPGGLNFQITELCLEYLHSKGLAYHTINDILGALEGAKLEFYRRVAVPYEDQKIKENGDVY